MGNHLVRRGGIWWARLAVPVSLRNTAGRREFVQSCRTHVLAIAKMVCAVLLARWRTELLQLQSYPMTLDVLKLVSGSPILLGCGQVPLIKAVDLSGISQDQLLRAAVDGTLGLFCRISQAQGHVVRYEDLEPISPEAGFSGGVVIPEPQAMPGSAQEVTRSGVYARRIVGWRQSSSMRTDFVLDALKQALYDRQPERTDALIHLSDRGSQYVSIRYSERLAEAGIEPSVGSRGDSYDTLWLKPSTACTRLN